MTNEEHVAPIPPGPMGSQRFPPGLERQAIVAKVLFLIYAPALVIFWYGLISFFAGPRDTPTSPVRVILWLGVVALGAAAYLGVLVACTILQGRLFSAGLSKHRGWQVIVGGVIFNPCLVGWWIPISVLLAVRRAQRAEQAEALAGRV